MELAIQYSFPCVDELLRSVFASMTYVEYQQWIKRQFIAHRLCPRRYAAGNQEVRWDAPDDWVPVERFPGEVVHGGIPRPDA